MTLSDSTTEIQQDTTKITRLNVGNLVAYIINLLGTFGIGYMSLFGLPSQLDLNESYLTIITPAHATLYMWPTIFFVEATWVVFQLAVKQHRDGLYVTTVGYMYIVSCALQLAWILTYALEVIWLSVVFMAGLMLCLWRIVQSLRNLDNPGVLGYAIWYFPFTMHAGWVSCVAVLQMNILLVDYHFGASVQYYAGLTSIIGLVAVAYVMLVRNEPDFVIPLCLGLNFVGVYLKLRNPENAILNTFSHTEINATKYAVISAAGTVFLSVCAQLIMTLIQRRRQAKDAEMHYLRSHD